MVFGDWKRITLRWLVNCWLVGVACLWDSDIAVLSVIVCGGNVDCVALLFCYLVLSMALDVLTV